VSVACAWRSALSLIAVLRIRSLPTRDVKFTTLVRHDFYHLASVIFLNGILRALSELSRELLTDGDS
jgi:hypothetical protein